MPGDISLKSPLPCLAIFATPGHTPGHQSMVVASAGHTELVVAQAAYSAHEFQLSCDSHADVSSEALDRCIESNATWSSESYKASLALLRKVQPDRAFFSHDPIVWRSDEVA